MGMTSGSSKFGLLKAAELISTPAQAQSERGSGRMARGVFTPNTVSHRLPSEATRGSPIGRVIPASTGTVFPDYPTCYASAARPAGLSSRFRFPSADRGVLPAGNTNGGRLGSVARELAEGGRGLYRMTFVLSPLLRTVEEGVKHCVPQSDPGFPVFPTMDWIGAVEHVQNPPAFDCQRSFLTLPNGAVHRADHSYHWTCF